VNPKFALMLCLPLFSTVELSAVSFDCAKARTPFEKAICSDPSLGKADDELNSVWKSTIATFPLPAFLRKSQQLWLQETAACAANGQAGGCLEAFSSRIELLKNLAHAKVYTNYGKQFSLDSVTLVVFEK
jgi:uncharacterized protein